MSSHTVKPNPPIIIKAINVRHTNQSPEYEIMLFLPSKSNPALQNADIEWKSENHKPLLSPKSGINLIDKIAIPIISIINVYIHIFFISFTNPLKESWFNDSLIRILSDKLSFFPIIIKAIDINVIKPIPPICIKASKIICPTIENCSIGITVVSPVTQTADVDTKSVSIICIGCLLAIGKLNSNAPITITAIIASNSVLVGPIYLFVFFIFNFL